jgi:hypothetical protein
MTQHSVLFWFEDVGMENTMMMQRQPQHTEGEEGGEGGGG